MVITMSTVYEMIVRRRTIRRFQQRPVAKELLTNMVNAARLAPSAANLQPLEFVIVNQTDLLAGVFVTTRWAGYIAPRGTPKEGERPVSYVVVLINRQICTSGGQHDSAAAIMSMILTAWERGVGSCWIISIDKKELQKLLQIPEHLEIDSILALGYPAEQPVVEELSDSVKYWQDEQRRLHVPKRNLVNILHWNGY